MRDYEQVSAQEWQWQRGATHYGVKVFAETGTLVWSNWVETSQGPQFGQGTRQSVEHFVEEGAPPGYTPPPGLDGAIRAALQPKPRKSWWRRGRK